MRLVLTPGEILVVQEARGGELLARGASVWVSHAGRDHVLAPGERLQLTAPDPALVSAREPAEIDLTHPGRSGEEAVGPLVRGRAPCRQPA